MTTHNAPGAPDGTPGAIHSAGPDVVAPAGDDAVFDSTPGRWSEIMTKPWFWFILLGAFWLFPLIKGLGVELPDPVQGADRMPEVFELEQEDGRRVRCADLAGHLVIIETLDFESPAQLEQEFASFRARKKRWRGLSSLVLHIVLAQNADKATLSAFIDKKTARKPNTIYAFDEGGKVLASLQEAAGVPVASVYVLDRHGRLRGSYGFTEAEGDRMAQDLASLANWVGSDPAIGQAINK
ncbi:MAG: cytochrome oxidase Cu insertion factor (SCO1/SenC/PrrC family) [Planctomycetota bacterium]|jgi:cytochrome oxidase Cu insertion factor (SCO1/SenC/PrrC family)